MAEQAAKVTVTGTAKNPVFNIDIPTGAKGERGLQGSKGDIGPTPALKLGEVNTIANPSDQEWIAGIIRRSSVVTSALSETFPSTMKGDKGDPGGFTTTSLNALDLNTVVTPGVYKQNSGVNATFANNYPSNADAGTLIVTSWGGTNEVMQEYTPYPILSTAVGKWVRGNRGGGWTSWRFLASQRVDNTAGRAIYTWDPTTNREQLIYGDSGWRDVTALLGGTWSATKVILRRDATQVTLHFDGIKSTTETANATFFVLPPGFTPDLTNGVGNLRYGLASELTGINAKVISPEPNANGIRFLSYTTGQTLHGSATFFTRDAWPTTLPGTAVGTIPNF